MSSFHPLIDIELENEHFHICDLLLSWIEQQRCFDAGEKPENLSFQALSDFLPTSITGSPVCAPGIAWNLVRIFNSKRGKTSLRMQLYYLSFYISTCSEATKLFAEYNSIAHQHLLQDDVHIYSLNNFIELQQGKLNEYLQDLASRSIAHVSNCSKCRAKGHYCQLCSSITATKTETSLDDDMKAASMNSLKTTKTDNEKLDKSETGNISIGKSLLNPSIKQLSNNSGKSHSRSSSGTSSISFKMNAPSTHQNIVNNDEPELVFPFEIGRVTQCGACGACYHLQCYIKVGKSCPKCERIQRRKEHQTSSSDP